MLRGGLCSGERFILLPLTAPSVFELWSGHPCIGLSGLATRPLLSRNETRDEGRCAPTTTDVVVIFQTRPIVGIVGPQSVQHNQCTRIPHEDGGERDAYVSGERDTTTTTSTMSDIGNYTHSDILHVPVKIAVGGRLNVISGSQLISESGFVFG